VTKATFFSSDFISSSYRFHFRWNSLMRPRHPRTVEIIFLIDLLGQASCHRLFPVWSTKQF
jgi:hypothetical protein